MGGFWGGLAWGFTFGSLFGAVIVGSIWARHFLRTYKENFLLLQKSVDVNTRMMAITETLNEDEIRAKADKIDHTQRLIRARGVGE
jgi:hypothetical protein